MAETSQPLHRESAIVVGSDERAFPNSVRSVVYIDLISRSFWDNFLEVYGNFIAARAEREAPFIEKEQAYKRLAEMMFTTEDGQKYMLTENGARDLVRGQQQVHVFRMSGGRVQMLDSEVIGTALEQGVVERLETEMRND